MGLVDVTPAHPLVVNNIVIIMVPPPMICSELSGFFLSSLNAPAGVEYSMKDIIPDKEPTDYEIRENQVSDYALSKKYYNIIADIQHSTSTY